MGPPLVALFVRRTGNHLAEYAGDLVSAAFPKFKREDVRSTVRKHIGRFRPSNYDGVPVPPLHQIKGKDTRRAAVELVMEKARRGVLEMEMAEINRKLKLKARKRVLQTKKETLNVCHPLCPQAKKEYARILGARLKAEAGKWQTPGPDRLGGIYFVCGRCKKVCHDKDDGLVETKRVNRCGKCHAKH